MKCLGHSQRRRSCTFVPRTRLFGFPCKSKKLKRAAFSFETPGNQPAGPLSAKRTTPAGGHGATPTQRVGGPHYDSRRVTGARCPRRARQRQRWAYFAYEYITAPLDHFANQLPIGVLPVFSQVPVRRMYLYGAVQSANL